MSKKLKLATRVRVIAVGVVPLTLALIGCSGPSRVQADPEPQDTSEITYETLPSETLETTPLESSTTTTSTTTTTQPPNSPLYEKYKNPTSVCDLLPQPFTVPTIEQAREIVKSIDFLENDIRALDDAVSRISGASSFEEAKEIASQYLSNLGINIVFRGIDQGGYVSAPNVEVNLEPNYVSVSSELSDDIKIRGVINLVKSFAAKPKKSFTSSEGMIFYVPEGLQEIEGKDKIGGFASTPVGEINEFSVTLSLEVLAHSMTVAYGLVSHEKDGHIPHFQICGISQFAIDPQVVAFFGAINPEDEFSRSTEYAEKAPEEFYAELALDFMSNSFSRPNTPRGNSPVHHAMELYVVRQSAHTGMPAEQLLALAEFNRVYGLDDHPLVNAYDTFAPSNISQWNSYNIREGNVRIIDTPDGRMPISCVNSPDQSVQSCSMEVSAALIDLRNISTPDWSQPYVDAILADGATNYGSQVEPLDPSNPQRSSALITGYYYNR